MRRTRQHAPQSSEITPLDVYLDRRRLLGGLAGGMFGLGRTERPSGQPAPLHEECSIQHVGGGQFL